MTSRGESKWAMCRRGAMRVMALLLVVLVGSAVAQTLSGDSLLVTGSGPHAIGAEPDADNQLTVGGAWTKYISLSLSSTISPPDGWLSPRFIDVAGTLNPVPGGDGYGVWISPVINKAASGAHGMFAGLAINTFKVGANTGSSLAYAAGLYIEGAPAGATNNYALWVARGTTRLDGLLHVRGDAQIDGNIAARYQDVAEWVRSSADLDPATVVVVDPREPNQVLVSDKAYDSRVAGVVSSQPGLLLGVAGADKAKVTHSGRVKVKVDARYGAIAIGDLLVTSATPGHAMRSEPVKVGGAEIHRSGTIIGKALEPWRAGQGEILVLVTLQ